MNIKLSDVVEKLTAIAGEDDLPREYCLELCSRCLRELQGMLIKAEFTSFQLRCIEDACAALAFYHHTRLHMAKDAKSFSAGDVSASAFENACEYAKEYWLNAKASIKDLLKPEGFCFCGVKVGD